MDLREGTSAALRYALSSRRSRTAQLAIRRASVFAIWDMRDKTVMTETADNRSIADAYRVAFVHERRADGSAGELQQRLSIRRLDVEMLTGLGASLRGRAAT